MRCFTKAAVIVLSIVSLACTDPDNREESSGHGHYEQQGGHCGDGNGLDARRT